jgi:hypothetical protein
MQWPQTSLSRGRSNARTEFVIIKYFRAKFVVEKKWPLSHFDNEAVVLASPASVAPEAGAGAEAEGALRGGGADAVLAADVLHGAVPEKSFW